MDRICVHGRWESLWTLFISLAFHVGKSFIILFIIECFAFIFYFFDTYILVTQGREVAMMYEYNHNNILQNSFNYSENYICSSHTSLPVKFTVAVHFRVFVKQGSLIEFYSFSHSMFYFTFQLLIGQSEHAD